MTSFAKMCEDTPRLQVSAVMMMKVAMVQIAATVQLLVPNPPIGISFMCR